MKPESGLSAEAMASAVEAYARALEGRKYANAGKLATVFEFWLFNYAIGRSSYDRMPRNCLNLFAHFSARDDIQFKKESKPAPNGLVPRAKALCWRLLGLLPVPRAIFPGGAAGRLDALMGNIVFYKLRSLNAFPDPGLKEDFLRRLGGKLPAKEVRGLETALPDDFFRKPIRAYGFPRRIVGSPSCLFDGDYLKALFLAEPVEFTGLQHGANYGEMKVNRVEEYEKKLSDTYFHWGLGERNIRQTRFPHLPARDRVIGRMILVGAVKPNDFLAAYFEGYEPIFHEAGAKQAALLSRLGRIGEVGYLMHPKYRKADGPLGKAFYLADLDEEAIHSTLFLLDKPGHTFLYKAIYEGIPFLLFYDRAWNRYFTPGFLAFLDRMEKDGQLFYWDQEEALLARVNELLSRGPFPGASFERGKEFLERGMK